MSEDATVTPFCGWCGAAHPITACPWGPRLSLASVLAFVAAAMSRPAREWA
jgi:hypothetical protein